MNHLVKILCSNPTLAVTAGARDIGVPASATDPLPSSFVWMPAGRHGITAHTLDGDGFNGEIICDEQAFRAIAASFDKILASGQRVWIDFDHEDGEAAAWVKSFSWDAARGILANIEWTAKGEQALRGKSYYSFSPAFAAEPKSGRVVRLLEGHAAGGLVNAPAFGAAMPALIAARLGSGTNKPASGGNPEEQQNIMKDTLIKLLAALKVTPPADATEEQLAALVAKNIGETKNTEIAALQAKLAELQAAKDAADKAQRDADAAKAANDALKTQVTELQAAVATLKVNSAATAEPNLEESLKGYAKTQDSCERGVFFAKNIAPVIAKMGGAVFSREYLHRIFPRLKDVKEITANSLGTLTGNLIAQQAIALAKYEYPILRLISTDFSNAAAKFNQTIDTRLKSALSASQYTSAYTAASATTTDVPIQLSHHPYCQVAFNANEIAGTNRDLFGEQAEAVLYAVVSDAVTALYALITSSNFTTTPLKLGSGTDGTTYARTDAIKAAKGLFTNKMPRQGRVNLLNADAYGALFSDSAVVSFAAYQKTDIITGYSLPKIADMETIQAVNLPTTGGMVGFAFHPRALAMAARPVNDYTQAVQGIVPGAVSQVTDSDTGLTVTVTQFVDHAAGAANYRIALMYGVAKGDPVAGIITESANGS